jgi:uncharacterized membrane protein YgcG
MKKTIIALTILAILSVLAACSKTSSTAGTRGDSAALSMEAQLLVGIFKLENTDLPVTSDQAKQLLPLWQTLQSLSTSNTVAAEEINAVVDQIKSSLTTQQMARITAMKLTQQDVMSIMSQTGVSPNGTRTTTTPMALNGLPGNGNSQGGTGGPGGGMQAGGPPAGGPSAGGGGFPAGGNPNMGAGPGGQSATPQAGRAAGMANQVPPPLLNALIELLQKKIK